MAHFNCELCKKEVKRGKRYDVGITEWIDDSYGQGFNGEESICKACAKKISRKIESMRK